MRNSARARRKGGRGRKNTSGVTRHIFVGTRNAISSLQRPVLVTIHFPSPPPFSARARGIAHTEKYGWPARLGTRLLFRSLVPRPSASSAPCALRVLIKCGGGKTEAEGASARPGRIYHVIRALSAVMSHYYTYNVVLALITEGQWWESVSTPELRTSTLNKAHPKKQSRRRPGERSLGSS